MLTVEKSHAFCGNLNVFPLHTDTDFVDSSGQQKLLI